MLDAERIAAAIPAYADILDRIETQYPGASGREQFQESVRELIDDLVSGLIEGTVAAAKRAGVANLGDVRRYPERIARFTPEAANTSRALKQFLNQTVYSSETLDRDRREATARLAGLFEYLLEHPGELPGDYRNRSTLPRSVCDYIAGMTDRFFHKRYEELIGGAGSSGVQGQPDTSF